MFAFQMGILPWHAIEGQNAAVSLSEEYLTWLKDHPNQREAVQAQLQKDHAPIDLGATQIEFTRGKEDIVCDMSPDKKRIESSNWYKEKPLKYIVF